MDEREIRAKVEAGNEGRILVVDIETGQYEIDDDQLAAAHRALAKHPGAPLYAMRIGYPSLAKIGGGWGVLKSVTVHCLEGSSLIGMSLLYDHLLAAQVVDGGAVTLAPLP